MVDFGRSVQLNSFNNSLASSLRKNAVTGCISGARVTTTCMENIEKRGKISEARLQVFKKAVDCLTEVIEKSSTENYVSNAWCLIRTFFWKHNGGRCFPKDMPVIVLEYNLDEEF